MDNYIKKSKCSILLCLLFLVQLDAMGQSTISTSESKKEYGINSQITLPGSVNTISTSENINVDMYTGNLNISIPLYEFKIKDLNIPIRIIYNINEVKPNLHPNIVGLGWSLQAGGAIYREIKDYPDELAFPSVDNYTFKNPPKKVGFLYNNYKFFNERESKNMQDLYGFNEWGKGNWYQENFIWDLAGSKILANNFLDRGSEDYSPDVFSFNFLGYSGTFYTRWRN